MRTTRGTVESNSRDPASISLYINVVDHINRCKNVAVKQKIGNLGICAQLMMISANFGD